jgi:hypothetical protein
MNAMDISPSEKVYPVIKIAFVLDALAAEGMSIDGVLKQMRLSKDAIASSTTRVSLNQIIDCYDYAASRVRDPYFAYRTGLRAHLSAYGMYGFAILEQHELSPDLSAKMLGRQGAVRNPAWEDGRRRTRDHLVCWNQ